MGLDESLSTGHMATMALSSACVIDVVALQTSPIVRTRHIRFTTKTLTLTCNRTQTLGLLLVALLATVPKVEIQIGALGTVPFSMLTMPTQTPLSLPRPRTWPLFLEPLLTSLFLSVGKNSLELSQLRLNDPGNSLNHIYWRVMDGAHHVGLTWLFYDLVLSVRRRGHRPSLVMS